MFDDVYYINWSVTNCRSQEKNKDKTCKPTNFVRISNKILWKLVLMCNNPKVISAFLKHILSEFHLNKPNVSSLCMCRISRLVSRLGFLDSWRYVTSRQKALSHRWYDVDGTEKRKTTSLSTWSLPLIFLVDWPVLLHTNNLYLQYCFQFSFVMLVRQHRNRRLIWSGFYPPFWMIKKERFELGKTIQFRLLKPPF